MSWSSVYKTSPKPHIPPNRIIIFNLYHTYFKSPRFNTMRFAGVASMAALVAVLVPACGAAPLGNVSTIKPTTLAVCLNNIHTESSVSRRVPREARFSRQSSRTRRVPREARFSRQSSRTRRVPREARFSRQPSRTRRVPREACFSRQSSRTWRVPRVNRVLSMLCQVLF
jgi:hypothetical protein